MERYLLAAAVLLVDLLGSDAAVAQPKDPQQQDIPTVTITGKLAGPPLWEITRGANSLWLFAALPVVPQDMEWDSSRVAQILSESDVFLSTPGVGAGFGLGALLMNRTGKLRALGDELERLSADRTLESVLDPALYQRLGHSMPPDYLRAFSHDRPWFAANKLRNIWIIGEGFANGTDVTAELQRLRRKYGVREVKTEVIVELEEAEAHLQQQLLLADETDTACLAAVLEFHENAAGVKSMMDRWFTGNVSFSSALHPLQGCYNGRGNPWFIQQKEEQVVQLWIDNLDQALTNNAVSFAVVPAGWLLDEKYTSFQQWLEQQGMEIRQANYDD